MAEIVLTSRINPSHKRTTTTTTRSLPVHHVHKTMGTFFIPTTAATTTNKRYKKHIDKNVCEKTKNHYYLNLVSFTEQTEVCCFMCEYLAPIDAFSLCEVSARTRPLALHLQKRKFISRRIASVLRTRCKWSPSLFSAFYNPKNKATLSGSYVLQIVCGEYWDGSDADWYSPDALSESSFGLELVRNVHANHPLGNKNDKELSLIIDDVANNNSKKRCNGIVLRSEYRGNLDRFFSSVIDVTIPSPSAAVIPPSPSAFEFITTTTTASPHKKPPPVQWIELRDKSLEECFVQYDLDFLKNWYSNTRLVVSHTDAIRNRRSLFKPIETRHENWHVQLERCDKYTLRRFSIPNYSCRRHSFSDFDNGNLDSRTFRRRLHDAPIFFFLICYNTTKRKR